MKKIAFTSHGKEVTDKLDSGFARSACFIVVNLVEDKIESFKNPGAELAEGPGLEAAKFIIDKKIEAIVSRHFSSRVYQMLNAAEVDVLFGIEGTVQENLEAFKKGRLDLWYPPELGYSRGKKKVRDVQLPEEDGFVKEPCKSERFSERCNVPGWGQSPPWGPGPAWGTSPPWVSGPEYPGPVWGNVPHWGPPPPPRVIPGWPPPPPPPPPWGGWYPAAEQAGGSAPWMQKSSLEGKIDVFLGALEHLEVEVQLIKKKLEELEKKFAG